MKVRGKQRTDSTHVLASIRVMNRLELVTETLRATLNELAIVSSAWLRLAVPPEWFARYGARIEDTRLPRGEAAREGLPSASEPMVFCFSNCFPNRFPTC